MEQEGFPVLLLTEGGGFAERVGNPLRTPLAKEMLHETPTASHPRVRDGAPSHPGGLGRQLSPVLRALERG